MSKSSPIHETAERNDSLWLLTISPAIWAGHFLLSYITGAVWCAKMGAGASLTTVRIAIVVYTVLALAGLGYTAWIGHRRQRFGGGEAPYDDDTPGDRHRFLGFSTLLLSGLGAIAVVYAALVTIVFRSCY